MSKNYYFKRYINCDYVNKYIFDKIIIKKNNGYAA